MVFLAGILDTEQFMQGDMPRGAGSWIEIFNMATKAVSINRRSLHGSDTDSRTTIPGPHPSQSFTRPTKTFARVMTHVL